MAISVERVLPSHEMRKKPLCKEKPYEVKQITVSEKRQMTIPKQFYDKIDIGNELICELHGDEIVLRPIRKEEDFSEEILKELVKEGFNGQDLIHEFQKRKAQIRPAVEQLIVESQKAAQQSTGAGDEETEELFGDVRE